MNHQLNSESESEALAEGCSRLERRPDSVKHTLKLSTAKQALYLASAKTWGALPLDLPFEPAGHSRQIFLFFTSNHRILRFMNLNILYLHCCVCVSGFLAEPLAVIFQQSQAKW